MKFKFPFFPRSAFWFLTMGFPAASHAAELQASDGAQNDSFGSSVATSGGFYGLIGATDSETGSGNGQGSAYLFRVLEPASGTITQNATLVASDRMSGDFFGHVAIFGNIAIVGASSKRIGNNFAQGAAYVFRNLDTANGTISQNAKLLASDGREISSFGGSVSISGTNGLIGAARNPVGINFDQGSAYLFRNLHTVTGTITQNVKLTASDGRAGDFFGGAVSLSNEGDNGLVGAPGVRFGSGLNQGAAYYFRNLNAPGTNATESSKLIASDGVPGDYFGSAVSLSGTTALIGAPTAGLNSGLRPGAAYLFRDLNSKTGSVTQQVKLVASDASPGGAPGPFFGGSVSLSGNQALVGARSDSSPGVDPSFRGRGAVYLFRNLDTATGVVTESVKITASDAKANDNFGSSVYLEDGRFIIGASNADGASADTGKAFWGIVGSFTTFDGRGLIGVIDGLSFVSHTDWIIGKVSGNNKLTLSAGDHANVTGTGMGVYIGAGPESHVNQLTIAGTLITNGVQIGSQALAFGNNLTIAENGIVQTGFIRGALGGDNSLKIDGGTIRFTESGTAITNFQPGDVRILDGGAIFDTQDKSIAIGTAMVGTGGLTKLGSGTLELSGVNAYAGQTLIREGMVQLGGPTAPSSIAGDVLIAKFGSLHGDGTIHGQLVNSGELSPGNSPGIIQVRGAFVQTHTGTLQMEITQDDHDRLITGSGTVLGGTLELVSDESTFRFGQRFNLIQSDAPITGDFESISTFGSGLDGFRGEFEIIGNSGFLLIAPRSYTQVATSTNEVSLASALDTWIDDAGGDTNAVSESLDQLSAAEYGPAFAAISPSLYGAALATGIEQSQSQSNVLSQHLNSRLLRQSPATDGDKHWDAWALSSGLYSSGSMSSLAGHNFSSGNFLSGIGRKLDATFSAGAFTGYGDSRGEFAGDSEIEQERFTLGAYATAQRDGYYANSALGLGILDMDVTRAIQFGGLSREAHSSTDGSEFFGLISGGYDFRRANWTFGPTGSLQYSKIRYDDVKEHGAGALDLAIGNPEDDSLRSLIGGRVAYQHKASEQLTLIPEARLFWQHEFLRDNDTLNATLEQGSGASFAHQVSDSDGDSVYGGVALGFQTNFGFYGNVSYDIEIGRESQLNHALSVGADWQF